MSDHEIRVIDVDGDKEIFRSDVFDSLGVRRWFAFSGDDRRIAVADYHNLHVWHIDRKRLRDCLNLNSLGCFSQPIEWLPNGQSVVIGSAGNLYLWNVEKGTNARSLPEFGQMVARLNLMPEKSQGS